MTRQELNPFPGSAPLAIRVFAVNEHMNQLLIENLNPAAWMTQPPGKVRTIAAIFTHVHNVRCKWIRLSAPQLSVPRQLNRRDCTPSEAREGLADSARGCMEMLDLAIGTRAGSVETFRRDGWGRAWPVGLEMAFYMVSHEAHHRGQICMIAHQLGFTLSTGTTSALWNWDYLWRVGIETGERGQFSN